MNFYLKFRTKEGKRFSLFPCSFLLYLFSSFLLRSLSIIFNSFSFFTDDIFRPLCPTHFFLLLRNASRYWNFSSRHETVKQFILQFLNFKYCRSRISVPLWVITIKLLSCIPSPYSHDHYIAICFINLISTCNLFVSSPCTFSVNFTFALLSYWCYHNTRSLNGFNLPRRNIFWKLFPFCINFKSTSTSLISFRLLVNTFCDTWVVWLLQLRVELELPLSFLLFVIVVAIDECVTWKVYCNDFIW